MTSSRSLIGLGKPPCKLPGAEPRNKLRWSSISGVWLGKSRQADSMAMTETWCDPLTTNMELRLQNTCDGPAYQSYLRVQRYIYPSTLPLPPATHWRTDSHAPRSPSIRNCISFSQHVQTHCYHCRRRPRRALINLRYLTPLINDLFDRPELQ